MAKKLLYSTIVGSLGNVGDRYTLGGYKPAAGDFAARLEKLAALPLLDGVEIFEGNLEGKSVADFAALVNQHSLRVSAVGVDLSGDPKWRYGSLIAKDPAVRAEAVAVCQR
ncbi:MAG: hypothetical protein LIP23_01430, partial [Planctomycetes bacterium]|nr:hypothetical protein [Planctomycetota bacterium]